jgi:hypothetical protein
MSAPLILMKTLRFHGGKGDILYLNRMNLYRQHLRYVPKLTRTEISAELDAQSYFPVGRNYLNGDILKKMTELEKLGAFIGNIYINPSKEIAFRAFITKPIWYIAKGKKIALWTNESEVQWIGK